MCGFKNAIHHEFGAGFLMVFLQRFSKFLAGCLLATVFVATFFLLAIYFDFSRGVIISQLTKHLASNGIELRIEQDRLTKTKNLFVMLPSKMTLLFKNVFLNKNAMMSRYSVEIDEFSFKSSGKKSVSGEELKTAISLLKIVRYFVESVSLRSGSLDLGSETYTLSNLSYHSGLNKDSVHVTINGNQFINLVLNRDGAFFSDVKLTFKNIFGFTGNLSAETVNGDVFNYRLTAQNTQCSVDSEGFFRDPKKEVIVNKVFLKQGGRGYDLHGKIYFQDLRSEFFTRVALGSFIDNSKIPMEILKNFKDVSANLKIKSDWNVGHSIAIEFMSNKQKLGKASAEVKGNSIELRSSANWIDILGYKLNEIYLVSNDWTNFKTNVYGNGFDIDSKFTLGGNISVGEFSFNTKSGKIVSERPFVLDSENMNVAIKFSLDDLEFFEKITPMKGKAFGRFAVQKDKIKVDAKIPRLIIQDCEIYNGNVFGDLKGNVTAFAKSLRYGYFSFNDLSCSKNGKKINVKSKVNGTSSADIHGTLNGRNLKFSGQLKKHKNVLSLTDCDLDFEKKAYRINARISSGKHKGDMNFKARKNQLDIKFDNFSISAFGGLFGRIFPECFVNGGINLKSSDGIFIGDGSFAISGIVSRGNILNVSLKHKADRFSVHGNLKNKTDNISLSATFPMKIGNDWQVLVARDFPVNISILGHVYLKNLFNLPDGCDLKGRVDSKLDIRGTLSRPNVIGSVSYSDAYISVGGILLKNGFIHLQGAGDRFVVTDSSFTDSYGKKAWIKGDGKLFFSGIMPNINANLNLNFDSFRLFDSDDLKIGISGEGLMTGPIDGMKISGKVKAPFCELNYFDMGDEGNKYKDIIVENDVYLSKKTKEKRDFFTYDVGLECPKIGFTGNAYDLDFKGDLNLCSYDGRASLIGRLKLKKGKLDLFGRRMIFSEGDVEFLKEYPFDPIINLLCQRSIDSMKAILEIKNTPGEGTSVNLRSEPHYTTDVILSKMLFGKSGKNLSVGEAAQLAHAISSLKQRGYIFSILNTFQNMGLVDSISFSTTEKSTKLYQNTQSSNNSDLDLKAGKYLNDDVYISVNKKGEETSFDVDISVNDNLSLKVNTLGEAGVSWRYRY